MLLTYIHGPYHCLIISNLIGYKNSIMQEDNYHNILVKVIYSFLTFNDFLVRHPGLLPISIKIVYYRKPG
jgi:hypothetical protein